MYLIVNKMMKLKEIHIPDCYRTVKRKTGSSVIKNSFAIGTESCKFKTFGNLFLFCSVKNRGHHLPPEF